MSEIERLIVEFFSALGAQVEFEEGEWVMQFDDPVSLTSLAIEIARKVGRLPQASEDVPHE